MRDKGIKIIERLKRLVGIYATAGEKRSVAVKALSVVLVFAVVLANLTVPNRKVKAANSTAYLTIDYGEYERIGDPVTSPVQIEADVYEYIDDYGFEIEFDNLKDHVFVQKEDDNGKTYTYLVKEFNVTLSESTDVLTTLTIRSDMNLRISKTSFTEGQDLKLRIKTDSLLQLKDIPIYKDENTRFDDNSFLRERSGELVGGDYSNVFLKYSWTIPSDATSPHFNNNDFMDELVGWKLGFWTINKVHSGDSQNDQFDDDRIFRNGDTVTLYINTSVYPELAEEGVSFEAVSKVNFNTTFDPISGKGTITSGSSSLSEYSATYITAVAQQYRNNWKIKMPYPEVAGNPGSGWIFSGWKLADETQSYLDSLGNGARFSINMAADGEHISTYGGTFTMGFNDAFAQNEYSNFPGLKFLADYEASNTLRLNFNFDGYNYSGSYNNYGQGYGITFDFSQNATQIDDDSFESGKCYEITIAEDDLKTVPIFGSDQNTETKYYGKGFVLKAEDSGRDEDQIVYTRKGNQKVYIDCNKFSNGGSFNANLYVVAQDSARSVMRTGASTADLSVPVTTTSVLYSSSLYFIYNVTLPNYSTGLVNTKVTLNDNGNSLMVKTLTGNAAIELDSLVQGETYRIYVPYDNIDDVDEFSITTSEELSLPIVFDATDNGRTDPNASKTYTSTQLDESTGNWTLTLTPPTVEVTTQGKEFNGWKAEGIPEIIGINKDSSGFLVQNTVITIPNTDAQSASSTYSLTFTADYVPATAPIAPEITISYSFADTEVAGNPDKLYEYANDSNNQYGADKRLVITAASTTPETDSDGTDYFTFTIPNDSITEYPIFADDMFSTPVYNRFSTSFSANTAETGMSSEQLIAVGGTGRTIKVKADKFTAANNYKYSLNLYAQNSTTKTDMNLYIQRETPSGFVPIISNLKKVELEQGMNEPQLYYTFELIGPDYSDSGSLYLPVKTSIYNENLYRYAGTAYDLVRVSCGNETPAGLNGGTVFEKGKVYTISMRDGIYRYGGIDGKLIVEGKVGLKFDVVFDAGDHGTCNSNPVTVTGGEDEDGSWKVPISNIPQVTPESGYVFKGWVAASQPESGNSIFVYSKDQNGYLNTANAYFTIGTFEDTNAEAMSVSADGYRFVAVYAEVGGPKLNINFSTGGSAQSFTAVSENPDDSGNYTYEVTLPFTSGNMVSVWAKRDIGNQGTNNVTFHVYNNSSCTEASEFGSADEIYGGETVYIKANVSSSQTYSWAPDASKGTVIRGSGTFTVSFVQGVSTSPLAPGEYTWTTDSDAYSYSANTSSRLYLYSNKSSMVFTITMH